MKVRNDEDWSRQESEINSTPEGQSFFTFLDFWFSAADTMLEEPNTPIGVAVRKALEVSEKEMGYLSADLIGQMLVVASMHWEHGPQFATELTIIERRVVEEALERKLAQLQEMAKSGNLPVDSGSMATANNSPTEGI